MAGLPGERYAGIFRLTDPAGLALMDLPVSAEVAATTGLWVGNAVVAEVAQYLVDYTLGVEGQPQQNPDGSYVVENVNEAFGAVARPFPLRLIVHNDGVGNARLLQRVFSGSNPAGQEILSVQEAELDPLNLEEARRLSVVHLPWTAANSGWSFDGPLSAGADITVEVALPYDDLATHPHLHTFHPDHDNLDARFENVLPRGVESYDIVRTLRLRAAPPAGDFASVTETSGTLAGTYEETVTLLGRDSEGGPHTRTFRSRGGFALTRASPIAELAGLPDAQP
jgi:hypothetical protein